MATRSPPRVRVRSSRAAADRGRAGQDGASLGWSTGGGGGSTVFPGWGARPRPRRKPPSRRAAHTVEFEAYSAYASWVNAAAWVWAGRPDAARASARLSHRQNDMHTPSGLGRSLEVVDEARGLHRLGMRPVVVGVRRPSSTLGSRVERNATSTTHRADVGLAGVPGERLGPRAASRTGPKPVAGDRTVTAIDGSCRRSIANTCGEFPRYETLRQPRCEIEVPNPTGNGPPRAPR